MSLSGGKGNYCRWYKVLLLKTIFLSPQIPNAICKLLYLFGAYHWRDQIKKPLNSFKVLGFAWRFLKLLSVIHVSFPVISWCVCKWNPQMENANKERQIIFSSISTLTGGKNKSKVLLFSYAIFSAFFIFIK